MKHVLTTRLQMFAVLACTLLCLFAFQAKLSQYEAIHTPLNDVSSNKICLSLDKRSPHSPALSVLIASVALLPAFIIFITTSTSFDLGFRSATFALTEAKMLWTAPILLSGPTVYRRPPPVL